MRVVHPSIYLKQRQKSRHVRRRYKLVGLVLLVVFILYPGLALAIKPNYEPRLFEVAIERQRVNYDWPVGGSVALSYIGADGVVEGVRTQDIVPTASTIKILTALVVLQKKPLGPDEPGELIVFTEDDVALAQFERDRDGSRYDVVAGETISYRQALEYMLVISANNIADKLAVWAFGDIDTYLEAANQYASDNNLDSTTIADASGFSAQTVSSTQDLIQLARLSIEQPLIKKIVSQPSVALPGGQTAVSTNQLLAQNGFIGIKTGLTSQAGACLLLAKEIVVGERVYTLLAVITGMDNRQISFDVGQRVLDTMETGFAQTTLVQRYQTVGRLESGWGEDTLIRPRGDLTVSIYRGSGITARSEIKQPLTGTKQAEQIGVMDADGHKIELELAGDLPKPSLAWRMSNVIDYYLKN